jgi:hypothetical protein
MTTPPEPWLKAYETWCKARGVNPGYALDMPTFRAGFASRDAEVEGLRAALSQAALELQEAANIMRGRNLPGTATIYDDAWAKIVTLLKGPTDA